MEMFFDINKTLLNEIVEKYSENAKLLIPKIREDRSLSEFDRFNKRFRISWGMKIDFADNLSITREDTRYCYMLMLKISDLWFSFEHLVRTASEVIPKDENPNSNVDFYQSSTIQELGFDAVTVNFNHLLATNVLHKDSWRQELYTLLSYLKNNTKGGTQRIVSDTIILVKDKDVFQAKHIFALAYAIRNVYVHQGVAAALGGKNYKVKRVFYSILYDGLVLYSLTLGNAYCYRKLASYSN